MEKQKNSTFGSSSVVDMPMTVFFVRHAQADSGQPGIDPDLTELGGKQAERIARRLYDYEFDHVYTSSMKRAKKTAEMIYVYHKSVPFTETDDLREVTHYHFLPNILPEEKALKETVRRERDAITRFVNHIRHHHTPGDRVLVVCHGNIIRAMLPTLGGRDPLHSVLVEINNTALTIVDTWPSGDAVVMLANCVRHLLARQVT